MHTVLICIVCNHYISKNDTIIHEMIISLCTYTMYDYDHEICHLPVSHSDDKPLTFLKYYHRRVNEI